MLATRGGRPTDVALATAAAYVPWAAILIWGGPSLSERDTLRLALALGAVAGLALVLAPPVLSDDVWRYLWDGRVLRAGISPYAHAPDHPSLAFLRDAGWRRVNNPEIPTIYPPVAQILFA